MRHLFLGGPAAAFLLALAVPATAQMPPNPPVDVALPLTDEVVDYDVYTGRFEARQEVELRARVSGYLETVTFEEGAMVEEDAILFTIDQRSFQTAVRRARAALAAAEASAELAQIELDRATRLAERNVGTEQEVDRTQAQLSESLAQVQVAQADLAQAELDLGFTVIRAPFSGRISEREVDPGNLVVGGTSGTTMLALLVSEAPLFFEFTISEADFLRYARIFGEEGRPAGKVNNYPVRIRLLDEDDYVHEGYLDFVDNALSANSGTIEVRAVVQEASGVLVPGLFGRVRVEASRPYEALLVPDEAVLSDQANKIIMTVVPSEEEGVSTVVPRLVTLGPLHRGMRVIRSGLEPDSRIIVAGLMRARPGATVTAVETTLDFAE